MKSIYLSIVCGAVMISAMGRLEAASNGVAAASILVTASPISAQEQVLADGANLTLIERSQIERLNAADLPPALRQIPGVTISRYSPIGAYGGAQGGSIYIRGAGTARPGGEIKIYTEGAPRESGVWSHPLMDIAPIAFADELRIAKNPQPQHYAGAFGAVDTALRRRVEQGHEAAVRMLYGNHQTLLGELSAGGREGDFDYYFGLSGARSDGARKHDKSELAALYLRGGWELSENERLAYIYQRSDNEVEDPGAKGTPVPRLDRFDTVTDTHILRWDSSGEQVKGFALFYFEDGAIRWRKDHLDDTPVSPAGNSNTDWHNYGFRSLFDFALGNLTATAGFDWLREGGSTANILEANGRRVWGFSDHMATIAPYLGLRYEQAIDDTWRLTPSIGTRYYHNDDYDDTWGPVAALTLERDGLKFFASQARGIHYPGVYARATSPQTWRDLEAEKLDTSELGFIAGLGERASVSATLYHSSFRDRMEMTSDGYLNSGDATSDGCEVALHLHPLNNLSLYLGGAYAHPRSRPASRLPEYTVSAGASWRVMRYLRWDSDCQYVASQYAYSVRMANPQLEKLDDFFVLNSRLALDLRAFSSLKGELTLALENITDTSYAYFPGYPMPGVMVYAGLKVEL